MMILLEFSRPPLWKPGYFAAPFNGGNFRRVWWLFFSVSLVTRNDLKEMFDYVADRNTEWRDTSRRNKAIWQYSSREQRP